MTTQYGASIALSCIALGIMMVMIRENGRMKRDTKKRMYLTYSVIILAAVTEAAALWLNGAPAGTRPLHLAVKGLDYCLSPLVGLSLIHQLRHEAKWNRLLLGILLANVALQAVSFFTGWLYYVDADNIYHHGPLYILYVLIYGIVIALTAWQFILYSRYFKSSNRVSLQMIVLFIVAGVAAQEVLGARVIYFALTLGAILLFIHNNEYVQQSSDDTISEQRTVIETDALTGMKSRYAYNEALNALNTPESLPEDTAVFMIDINGLKQVNDMRGHIAGDELIRSVAQCISEVFSPYGACYRTGGDEFVAILHGLTEDDEPDLCAKLIRTVGNWRGELVPHASVSYGYVRANEFPDKSVEELIRVADERMYWRKAQYYKSSGRDRRRR